MNKEYKEIILNKLKITERGALNILSNKELCDRIVTENIFELKEAAKAYNIPIYRLNNAIHAGKLSYISNGKQRKGRKKYLFENEIVSVFGENDIKYKLKSGARLKDTIKILNSISKKILNPNEYLIYSMALESLTFADIARGVNLTNQRVEQIYQRSVSKMNSYINKFILYEDVVNKTIELNQKKDELEKHITTLIKSGQNILTYAGMKEIDKCSISERLKHILIEVVGIYTINELNLFINENGIDFFKKFRNLGEKTFNELKKLYEKQG